MTTGRERTLPGAVDTPEEPGRPAGGLLTPSEAAHILGVGTGTLLRWEGEGRLTPLRTPGGDRRYRRNRVLALAAPAPPLEEVVATLRQVNGRALEIGAREEAVEIARLMAVLDAGHRTPADPLRGDRRPS